MLSLKTILVAIDSDQSSDRAIEAAHDLARMGGGRIILVHVWDAIWGYDVPGVVMNDVTLEVAKGARAMVAARERELAERWPATSAIVRQGDVCDVVLEVIAEEKCDLLVLGTHGATGVMHLLLGSVAEKLVRLAPIPVLTVRNPASGRKPLRA